MVAHCLQPNLYINYRRGRIYDWPQPLPSRFHSINTIVNKADTARACVRL